MTTETEIKFAVDNFDDARRRLTVAQAEYVGRCFEVNTVYDTREGKLKGQGILLRLRRDVASLLTVKVPVQTQSLTSQCPALQAKVCEEYETAVASPEATESLLKALGFEHAFSYEKVRETWKLEDVLVCLDMLPFGFFLELEGDKDALCKAVATLGLELNDALAENYHALNAIHRRNLGLPPQDGFCFSPQQAAQLRCECAGIKNP